MIFELFLQKCKRVQIQSKQGLWLYICCILRYDFVGGKCLTFK